MEFVLFTFVFGLCLRWLLFSLSIFSFFVSSVSLYILWLILITSWYLLSTVCIFDWLFIHSELLNLDWLMACCWLKPFMSLFRCLALSTYLQHGFYQSKRKQIRLLAYYVLWTTCYASYIHNSCVTLCCVFKYSVKHVFWSTGINNLLLWSYLNYTANRQLICNNH
jgi:hypothetical protein